MPLSSRLDFLRADLLRADIVFAWRRLRKSPVTSAAAVLSLALAMGACTAAFRIVDALLLRPLPVADPGALHFLERHAIGFDGKPHAYEEFEYPLFQRMRAAMAGRAELLAISNAERTDLTYKSDQEMEKAYRQFVSGSVFSSFGLRPAAGRLLTEADERAPGAHPYVVLSYDYWTRRFGQDPQAVGRTVRMGQQLFEIVGVAEPRFTGTEPGTVTDVFVPTMMHPCAPRDDCSWFRTWLRLPDASRAEPLRAELDVMLRAYLEERMKGFTGKPQVRLENFVKETLTLESASAGVSTMQQGNRQALVALAVLVALVLLIACANVANLMTAQAAARTREMALRVSIGARRSRLLQLVLVESACVAVAAAALGALFAWWAAPLVIGLLNPPDNPARLALPTDWRVLGFGLSLTLAVTALFGLAPALRASAVQPADALKAGKDPHGRRRMMHALIAAQVAFCVLVLFVSGLFVVSFNRLSNQPVGFDAGQLLIVDSVADPAQPAILWEQVADRLRALPGVEQVAMSGWPLLNNTAWNGYISIDGAPPVDELAYFLNVSPGWVKTMKIPFVAGTDFAATDTQPGAAIVNETFVKTYFGGQNPVGRSFERPKSHVRFRVVGVVRDAPYRRLREPILPTAFVPLQALDDKGAPRAERQGAFLVRTTGADPLALASLVREEVRRARPGFRVSTVRTQAALVASHTVRERLLALLASFFAIVALGLAAVGLHGVLHYSVLQRRHEIGIRMALGAQAGDVARGVTTDVFVMVFGGAAAGLAAGLASARSIEALFYQVRSTDPAMLAAAPLTMLAVALLAALPAILHAVRIDPITTLRGE